MAIIYVVMLIFLWKIYVGLGADLVWDNLMIASEKNPVIDNREGTYLTMWSTNGLIFGICNIVGNFGTVFVDNSYWQNAIAARPSGTYKGYLIGGIAWFSIPFTMATTLGLAARAMDLPITKTEAGLGLVPPAVAVHVLGEGGAFLILFQLFMAVTDTACAEQIASSAIFSYDVFKRYLHPKATGKQILFVSRVGVFAWSILSGVLAVILFELKIGLGWIYVAMGNFIGSAVFPVAFALTWKRCSGLGAVLGCWVGLGLSMLAWCLAAQSSKLGKGTKAVNVDTLGDDLPSLAGNLVALLSSPVVCVVVSLIWPQKDFDWDQLKKKTEDWLIEDDIDESERVTHSELIGMNHGEEDSEEQLSKVLYFSYWFGGGLSIVLIIIWPLLTLPEVSFSKSYWNWWVAIGFIWAHCAAFVTMVYPIWEIRQDLHDFFAGKKEEEVKIESKIEPVHEPKTQNFSEDQASHPIVCNLCLKGEFFSPAVSRSRDPFPVLYRRTKVQRSFWLHRQECRASSSDRLLVPPANMPPATSRSSQAAESHQVPIPEFRRFQFQSRISRRSAGWRRELETSSARPSRPGNR